MNMSQKGFIWVSVIIFNICLLLMASCLAGETIVLVATRPADSAKVMLQNKILTEAFAMIGYNYESIYYPAKRGAIEASLGLVDGEAARIYEFNEVYPTLVRVDEPHATVEWAAYALNPDIPAISSWEDLSRHNYKVGYKQGGELSEAYLNDTVDKERLEPVSEDIQGFRKLLANRHDIYIGVPRSDLDSMLESEDFKDSGIRDIGTIASKELYVFLHEKHKNLVPKLAEALRIINEKKESHPK